MQKKIIHELLQRGVKKKQIRIFSRSKKQSAKDLNRELGIFQGSVWGIDDASIPFDSLRKLKDIKQSLRPCVVLNTPESYRQTDLVSVAPGTSTYHASNSEAFPCLIASVPPENLKKTTYFLLYFRWVAVQKTLQKKLTELSNPSKDRLRKIVGG